MNDILTIILRIMYLICIVWMVVNNAIISRFIRRIGRIEATLEVKEFKEGK